MTDDTTKTAPDADAEARQASGTDQQAAAAPGASGVGWLKYKRLSRLLTALQKRCTCAIDVSPTAGRNACSLSTDEAGARVLDKLLGRMRRGAMARGVIVGLVLGVFAAYVLIPSGVTYVYSSKAGILPPEYDALMRAKNINEQAVQILEHEFKPKSRGMFGGKKVYFETELNDSSTLMLTYDKSRKGLVASLGQRVGSGMAGDMVEKHTAGSGMDAELGDAVRRTTSMQVEKGFRSNPVLCVKTRIDGREVEFVNYCAPELGYQRDFLARDADTTDIKHRDHTHDKRDHRVPTVEEERLYRTLVHDFVLRFRKGEIEGDA